ncbi:MAG: branched-chain amino acid ABC transporter permease [Ignavibacteria bacterium]|nr:branched-chain amino acid ABC transporter permease [Ignavibacteria bacterium]
MKNTKLLFLISIAVIFGVNLFSGSINSYYYQIIIYCGINIVLATSLNLINGYTGQFSLGHAGFMAIGAYVSAALSTYLAPTLLSVFGDGTLGRSAWFILVLLMGGTGAAIAGIVVGVPSLRLKGDYLAITTLGFSEIIRVTIQNLTSIGASQGFRGVYVYDNGVRSLEMVPELSSVAYKFYDIPKYTDFFWAFLVVAIIIFGITNLMRSTYGRGFIAVKDDEIAAEAMGVNTTRFKVTAFVIGAFFAGVAGGLYAHFLQYINPEDFNFLRSVEIVAMVILGGMGSTFGVVLAAIILTVLPELLRDVQQYRMIIYALLLIIMMLLRPQGLFGIKLERKKKKVSPEEAPEATLKD